MAVLEQSGTGARCHLLARHLVGRSRLAHLRLHEPSISGEHALVCWTGKDWEIHDLGSRNGTFVNGRRLAAGERAHLGPGAEVSFGTTGRAWRLVDDSPPSAMAVPEAGGEPLLAEGGFLALPDPEEPDLLVYCDRVGEWVMDADGDIERVRDGHEVAAGGQRFVLHLPDALASTLEAEVAPPSIDTIALRFAVSRDEEYVTLTAVHDRGTIDLGARSHHYLLLTLARARLGERDQPASARGWVYQDDLAAQLDLDDKHLNIVVFRCRRHLGAAGILGAASIIERRKPTRQLRLGVDRIEIVRV